MRRVAHVSLHGDPLEPLGSIEAGGQNVYVKNVALQLARRQVQVDVFTRWNDPTKARLEEFAPGARSVRLKGGPVGFVKKERTLEFLPELLEDFAAFCRHHHLHYDLIHTHYYIEGAFGLQLARIHHLPQVHTFHSLGQIKLNYEKLQGNPDAQGYGQRLQIERNLMSHADLLVATSPFEAQDFRDWYGHDNTNVGVVPCGLDPRIFSPKGRRKCRSKLGLPQERTILLFVGRLDPRKGMEVLLFAYRKLLFDLGARSSQVLLVVVGGQDGEPQLEEFRKLAASLGLREYSGEGSEGNVLFAGSHPQPVVAEYYSAADMTLVPSYYEPFGMVAIETQACGTPAIVSSVGGLRYAINGTGGLLAKPYSPADLAEKMLHLVLNHNERRELARNGRQRVLRMFTWEAVADQLFEHYEKLIGVRPSRTPLAGTLDKSVPAPLLTGKTSLPGQPQPKPKIFPWPL